MADLPVRDVQERAAQHVPLLFRLNSQNRSFKLFSYAQPDKNYLVLQQIQLSNHQNLVFQKMILVIHLNKKKSLLIVSGL